MLQDVCEAATYYVSPSGNDANPGTEAQPWATFNRAWGTIVRGDTLVLLDGTYYQTLAPNLPAPGATPLYVTIKAKNDGKAVIDGQGVRRAVELWNYRSVSHIIIEGIVGRNGPKGEGASVWYLNNHHAIIRRCSGHSVDTDTNTSVFLVWGHHNLIEDSIASGSGRKMFLVIGDGSDGYNIIRRSFAMWGEWLGRDYCIRWPYGAGFEVYDQPNNIFENNISYARTEFHHFYIKTDNPGTNPKSHHNQFLGNIAIKAGINPDGTLRNILDRPTPTSCNTTPGVGTMLPTEGVFVRAGFSFYRGGDLLNTTVQDNLSVGNAGAGFAVYPSLTGSMAGSVFRRNTAFGNGVDGPIGPNGWRWGGPGVDMLNEDFGYFTTVADNKIAWVHDSWPGCPNLATRVHHALTGEGARLRYRYVDGTLMDGFNGQPAQSLWPWPMEQRIQDELGISVTNLIASIAPEQVPGGACTYTVSPTSVNAPTSGGSSNITVTANAGCGWTASSNASWATVSPTSGTGGGSVTLTSAANTGTSSRNATLTIAGQSVTVSQAGPATCTYSVSPTTLSPPAAGGTTTVTVTAGAGCSWTASTNASWATVSPTAGAGAGSVAVTTVANTGSARNATLTIAGQSVTVNQAAPTCAYSVSPTTLSAPAAGTTASVTVTTSAGCAWTTASGAGWASVSPASGSGAGSATVTVSSNSGSSGRNTTVTVAGQAIPVSQAGTGGPSTLTISGITASPGGDVGKYKKLEITFQVAGSAATMMQWPYDPAPPNGVPAGVGISVNAVFTDPDGRQFQQPAFYAQDFLDEIRNGRDWHLPTGNYSWKVRFSPNRVGNWSYKLTARDQNGTTESATYNFSVVQSGEKGFVRVSAADGKYFEFDNGSLFVGQGFELPEHLDDPTTTGAPKYAQLGANGIDFARIWLSGMYGVAWPMWLGGRNLYDGYLPRSGLRALTTGSETRLTQQLTYPQDWFDSVRGLFWDDPPAVARNTTYRVQVTYRGIGITGPRVPGHPHGLVVKFASSFVGNADEWNSAGTVITTYGGSNSVYETLTGTWASGNNDFLPRVMIALTNVTAGEAYLTSISVRADLGSGVYGPEILEEPSFSYESYIPEEKAYALDKIIALAEQNGVALKLVLGDKNDEVWYKLADNGAWITSGSDNVDGFYGLGRTVNKTRWLQQMWWRYAQARWGYSTGIHSWELTNEGDPFLTKHYEATDELGKFMHCRVFGVEPGAGDGARCTLDHPNRHLVTTSFWHSFPATQFWGNTNYPNVDYADVHAYVSTSYAPLAERQTMQWDAAYYHTWHSRDLAGWQLDRPIVRGEAGLDSTDEQSVTALGLDRDTGGVWLHNFLWSRLDPGGLYEIYWWSVPHIWSGSVDHRPHYKSVRAFLNEVTLNKGGYVDWGGSVTNSALRVVGQKNTATASALLWVQNNQHTWKNVVDGVSIAPASGEVIVPGFTPSTTYTLERWNTYAADGQPSFQSVASDAAGNLRISVSALTTDVAFRVSQGPRAPTAVRVTP